MRLAISNIAWAPEQATRAYEIMNDLGVQGLEIAPGQAFATEPEPFAPSHDAVERWRREIEARSLVPVSMQSLLYGVSGARLFGSPEECRQFEDALARAIDLAHRLAIPNLVVGSPGNRTIPDGVDRAKAEHIAIEVFRRLGDSASAAGATLALEPVPRAYGTNFLNTVEEAADFARRVDHPAVRINFDIGCLLMNGDIGSAPELFASAGDLVAHVHISEPHLAPVTQSDELRSALRGMAALGHKGWVSIEMRSNGHDSLDTVRSAITRCKTVLSQACDGRAM